MSGKQRETDDVLNGEVNTGTVEVAKKKEGDIKDEKRDFRCRHTGQSKTSNLRRSIAFPT